MNGDNAHAQARGLACDRFRSYLSRARDLGIKGSIDAARQALESAGDALDDIAGLDEVTSGGVAAGGGGTENGGMGACDDLAACGNPGCEHCHPSRSRGTENGDQT